MVVQHALGPENAYNNILQRDVGPWGGAHEGPV